MASLLYKYIMKRWREREEENAVSTTDNYDLVPRPQKNTNNHCHEPQQKSTTTGSQTNFVNPEQAAKYEAEAHRRKTRQWKLMLGLTLPNFLAAVDVTIVAPAIPLISTHFDQLSGSFNWIVAAYTLTFTTFVPASGQLADIYGRHFALQFEMFWITIGSVLCAAAQSWGMLLMGRALQGLGAAGIMNLSRIILSDGATLAENSRGNSILSLISGCSYGVGPVVGGYLSEASWRYVFVLPVGVAVVAMLLIFFVMRDELVHGRVAATAGDSRRKNIISGLAIIDWPGLVMFILGVGLIILAVQWGGIQYSWSSAAVLASFIIGGFLCVAFFGYEYLLGPRRAVARTFPSQVPMIPSTLFRRKDTALLMMINFSAGISLVSAFYFISYYWQFAEGYSSSQAGIQLLYYTPGLGVGAYVALYLCNSWPRQTFSPLLIGSVVEGVGLALLTFFISVRNTTMVKVFLAVAGAGTGLRVMPVVLHAAGIWSTRISSMQSLLSFMLPLGETIGISVMGAVFSNKFSTLLSQIPNPGNGFSLPSSGIPSLDFLDSLPAGAKEEVENAAAKAVMWAFISVLPFVGFSIVASVFLGNVWIGEAGNERKHTKEDYDAEKGKVLYGVYLLALVKGGIASHKQDLEVNREVEGREKVVDVEAAHVDVARPIRTYEPVAGR